MINLGSDGYIKTHPWEGNPIKKPTQASTYRVGVDKIFKTFKAVVISFLAITSVAEASPLVKRQGTASRGPIVCCTSCDVSPSCEVTLGGKNFTLQRQG
jgi:hypothetical protein